MNVPVFRGHGDDSSHDLFSHIIADPVGQLHPLAMRLAETEIVFGYRYVVPKQCRLVPNLSN